MKLLVSSPSFSSCSSSSTTTAFDATMCSSKSATPGCIAGILRRILCYGSFPTYPSDHITEEEENSVESSSKDQDFNSNEKTGEKTEISATPSMVARLMGLDSIPDDNLVSSQSTQNSVSRSKSMNSADRFDGSDSMQHHRVKSSQSFREMPTFFELDNEEFFVLTFESERKSKETKTKGRKCEKEQNEKTENRRKRKAEKKKQLQEGQSRRTLKDLNGREMMRSRSTSDRSTSDEDSKSTSIATKTIEKKKTTCDVLKNVESEFSSEDLSPVSILDCGQFLVDPEVLSSEEDPSLANSCKENCPNGDARRTKTRQGNRLGPKKKEFHRAKHIGMWSEIYRLTEAELVGSNWIIKNKGTWNFEAISAGIGADFESQILGQLLDELVDQFADFPMEIQNL
ncbi:lisH domain-containing protein-like [Pyrus ussuriensis x Pyrus communis]|uniref:LisH domain-containing protein-like n=1 Tax=Pyrus ussuriensis x Pyrus communis TaxID=2448454 RepID=A0A5N5GLX1_9ROSA|nr:lisH domain-containing protein-like [Pyrus ussuriensis x Pyrus communis]